MKMTSKKDTAICKLHMGSLRGEKKGMTLFCNPDEEVPKEEKQALKK